MQDLGRLERRCRRLHRTVTAPAADQIVLLRTARILKSVHDDLEKQVWSVTREHGRTREVLLAEEILGAMDRHLRTVLLDYGHLSSREIAVCLRDVLGLADELIMTLQTMAAAHR